MLYANCKLVKGNNRSAIYDLHRGTIQIIPNDLYNIFINNNTVNVNELLDTIDLFDRKVVVEYFDFLAKQDYGLYGNKQVLSFYKNIETDYNYPFVISNILIDIDCFSQRYLKNIINEIDENNIRNVEIRIFHTAFNIEQLHLLHDLISKSNIQHLSLVLPYNNFQNATEDDYCLFRFSQLVFYNSEDKESIEHNGTNVFFSLKKNIDSRACGMIDMKYFSVNISSFTESINHNSCLNRKISIDLDGNIKNCPSFKDSFGNIENVKLDEALKYKGFKKRWDISKDKIAICKDCEFRHACTDCRAYKENPEDDYSKPLKCGYSPYTNKWEEWSTNPLKQKAIEYYGMQDLVKKND